MQIDPIQQKMTSLPSFTTENHSSILMNPEDFRLPEHLSHVEKKEMTHEIVSFLMHSISEEEPFFTSQELPQELYKNLVQVYVKGVLRCLQVS